MSNSSSGSARDTLKRIAHRVMKERGFLPDFSRAVLDELEKMQEIDWVTKADKKDLRHLLWASIDNDDSLDLDQLTVAETLPDNRVCRGTPAHPCRMYQHTLASLCHRPQNWCKTWWHKR